MRWPLPPRRWVRFAPDPSVTPQMEEVGARVLAMYENLDYDGLVPNGRFQSNLKNRAYSVIAAAMRIQWADTPSGQRGES